MTIELKDKLYTSTEVANILGVSLRSVYRYLDEGKLQADVKTATGRHRFSKQNILDFLYPTGTDTTQVNVKESKPVTKAKSATKEADVVAEDVQKDDLADEDDLSDDEELLEVQDALADETNATDDKDEEVDWLAKFRAAAEKYREEQAVKGTEKVETAPQVSPEPQLETQTTAKNDETVDSFIPNYEEVLVDEKTEYYYLSGVGGLKEIAQSLDKAAKKASLDYVFTMDAGLSLFKPIRPFSIIHAYVRSSDRDYYEKALKLTEVAKSSAQLCLLISDEAELYKNKKEMYGLNVVNSDRLRMDLLSAGEKELVDELENVA